ncbi:hypothetical protein DAI22_09g083700 [Oryza sativa Japonica Group]|nr:hypothetical protein DAI22_09g083700 [Oryza sativa Japonica Group]KAF2916002.1 hypothetical protein DAI22_09g083700 [Oryza sativa Japonica Group]
MIDLLPTLAPLSIQEITPHAHSSFSHAAFSPPFSPSSLYRASAASPPHLAAASPPHLAANAAAVDSAPDPRVASSPRHQRRRRRLRTKSPRPRPIRPSRRRPTARSPHRLLTSPPTPPPATLPLPTRPSRRRCRCPPTSFGFLNS